MFLKTVTALSFAISEKRFMELVALKSGIENATYILVDDEDEFVETLKTMDEKHRDGRIKRYHAWHCPFTKESILMVKSVSKTMCFCSLGHTKVFWEAALDTELKGDVLKSALDGYFSCQFIIYLTDEIMKRYVHTAV